MGHGDSGGIRRFIADAARHLHARQNVAKADALVRGIWKDETAVDRALARAKSAMSASGSEID
jgi:hypothetical protein